MNALKCNRWTNLSDLKKKLIPLGSVEEIVFLEWKILFFFLHFVSIDSLNIIFNQFS